MSDKPIKLPAGTLLEQYRLVRCLGYGGFSIVYLATDRDSGETVVIKEFYPTKLATRDDQGRVRARSKDEERLFTQARKLFFQEAGLLSAFDHPNIVNIRRFFTANGTTYSVMDYRAGRSLFALIKQSGGGLSEAMIRRVFPPVLRGLSAMHEQGVLHLDIKPGNIYLPDEGQPLLLDFGAVRKILTLDQGGSIPVVSQGYSPLEQMRRGHPLGPWTDLYAVGASMRACIEGQSPMAVRERCKKPGMPSARKAFSGRYSQAFLGAIDWAMALKPENRPQAVEHFLPALAPPPREPRPADERPSGWARMSQALRHKAAGRKT